MYEPVSAVLASSSACHVSVGEVAVLPLLASVFDSPTVSKQTENKKMKQSNVSKYLSTMQNIIIRISHGPLYFRQSKIQYVASFGFWQMAFNFQNSNPILNFGPWLMLTVFLKSQIQTKRASTAFTSPYPKN